MSDTFNWTGAGRVVPIEVRRSAAARRVTLRVDATRGVIRVSLPPRAAAARALALIDEQHAWIAARVARWTDARPFAPGTALPFEGRELVIDWAADAPRTPRIDGDRLVLGGPVERVAGRVERFLRAEALARLGPETLALAGRAGRAVAAVSVRDTSSRWGSCASGGRIAYSWRLVLAPVAVRRAVVAHEVAHLVHMNHSPAFWRLAAELYGGDLKPSRRWLAANGASLHRVGRPG